MILHCNAVFDSMCKINIAFWWKWQIAVFDCKTFSTYIVVFSLCMIVGYCLFVVYPCQYYIFVVCDCGIVLSLHFVYDRYILFFVFCVGFSVLYLRCVWLWHSVVSSFVYDCWILFSVLCMIISIISSLCMTVGKCCLVILCMIFAYCYLYWVYDCQFYVFAVYACGMVLYLYCVWLLDRWLLIVLMIIGYCFRFVGWFSVLHLRCVYDSAVSLLSVIVGYCLFIV